MYLTQDWFTKPNMVKYHEYYEVEKYFDTETKSIYIVEEDPSDNSIKIQQLTDENSEYRVEYLEYIEYLASTFEAEDTRNGFPINFWDLTENTQARLYRHLDGNLRTFENGPIAIISARREEA